MIQSQTDDLRENIKGDLAKNFDSELNTRTQLYGDIADVDINWV
jgi:hypothetical protein